MKHIASGKSLSCVIGLLLFLAIMGFAASDGCTFSRLYMSVNNQVAGDHTYQAIYISPCNPMQICTDTELVASIQNGYTGYLYLGSPRCPYCRNTVPSYWSRLRLPASAGFCRALCKITIIVLNIQMSALSRHSTAPLPTILYYSCWMPILHPNA